MSPTPSAWLRRFAPATPGTALDLACGSGRNLAWLAAAGWRVTGLDRDTAATAPLRAQAEIIDADIESGPWPLAGRRFDLVVVCNYLWRPLLGDIRAAVEPGGWLVWETFADGQQSIGRPSRPEFLLQRGELLRVCEGWNIVAYEDLFENGAKAETPPRFVQRVAAVRPP
ncbi:class I SAM-dependent methyltransferase [Pelomonas aquatica]|jgi:SAM-dependent methyltransferase|uniref:Class I SAM-dependent methyltransferase n=1 Tax=Pelomonas aquatica TaxID=431058 RepID=A0A9X4R9C5_9BURK|nr:class I SAM-dependent methyltransferase [Pelomonas aquatica]MCY4756932.1 class I SAM-dependent methyltransferase [Pelomonas aquatica]MDG0864223.1 class I SAM-dependent methyltransferase [Pelomonas aquatica]